MSLQRYPCRADMSYARHCAQEAGSDAAGVGIADMFLMTTSRAQISSALSRFTGWQGGRGELGEGEDDMGGGKGDDAGETREGKAMDGGTRGMEEMEAPAAIFRTMCNVMLWPLIMRHEPLAAKARELGMTEAFPSPSQHVFSFLFRANPEFASFAHDTLSRVPGLSTLRYPCQTSPTNSPVILKGDLLT